MTGRTLAGFSIRPYERRDLESLYEICLRTGDSGGDATHLHDDPQALGHLYAAPYAALEPGLAFVLEAPDVSVCGYILGALDTREFHERFVREWLPQVQGRVPDPQGDPESWTPTERIYHRLHHARLHAPARLDEYPSHLHIDLLPVAQGKGQGRRLMERLLGELRTRGSPGVHLGVGEKNVRAYGFYRRLGFAELERAPGSAFLGLKLEGERHRPE